jgi:hypothetical protein
MSRAGQKKANVGRKEKRRIPTPFYGALPEPVQEKSENFSRD